VENLMRKTLKELIKELENKIDIEDWAYARDITKEIERRLEEKLKESV
jgi:hypothetical protein